jgi:hypothetical protein
MLQAHFETYSETLDKWGGGPEIGGVPQISKKHHKTYKQRYKKQKQLPGPGGPRALVVLSCCLYILGGGVKSWR